MMSVVLAAAASRVAMSVVPNVEPVMSFVLLAAMTGVNPALVGLGAILLSDLFLGLGPWTVYTSLSYGLVGLLASFFKPKNRREVLVLAGGLTLVYDLITNIGFALTMSSPILVTLWSGVPFSLLHVLSNSVICAFLLPETMDLVDFSRCAFERVIGAKE